MKEGLKKSNIYSMCDKNRNGAVYVSYCLSWTVTLFFCTKTTCFCVLRICVILKKHYFVLVMWTAVIKPIVNHRADVALLYKYIRKRKKSLHCISLTMSGPPVCNGLCANYSVTSGLAPCRDTFCVADYTQQQELRVVVVVTLDIKTYTTERL